MQIQLTEKEQRTIEEFSEKIDLGNEVQIAQYGSVGQKKTASLSNHILEKMQDQEFPEVKKVLEDLETLTAELEKEEAEEQKFCFVKKNEKKSLEQKIRLEKMNIQLDKISDKLLLQQDELIKAYLLLEKMYEKNQLHYKELTMYLLAGKKKIEKVSGISCEQLEGKLYDLEISKALCLQLAAQLELLQQNHTKLSEKIQCAVHQAIPLWKNRITLLLEKND